MILITGQKGGFFGCGSANRTGTCSHKRLIKRTRIEKEIVDYIRSLIKDESSFEKAAKHYNRLMNEKLNYAKENLDKYESELAIIEIELKNLSDAISRASSETLIKSLETKEERKRYLKHQIRQIKADTAEKVYVTPGAMREKFKKLSNALRSKPGKAAIALQKVFPEGLKMQWNGGNWEIRGLIIMDSKGGTSDIELVVK